MYELRVLNGLHRGAALPLIGNKWNIGTEKTSDLVLFDSGIKSQHCQLIPTEHGWMLNGAQGKITDTEGHHVDNIEDLKPDTAFALNNIWMTIVDASTPWPDDKDEQLVHMASPAEAPLKPQKKVQVLPFVLGFISAATIAATSTWAALSPSEKPLASTNTSAQKVLIQPLLPPQIKLASYQKVTEQLRKMLEERELGKAVTMQVHGQTVQLNGALNPEQHAKLRRMITRFQDEYDTQFQIKDEITPFSPKLPFKIVQITSGKMGNVVTNDGKRLFVGDEFDGIRLVSIEPNRVLFKGQQSYEVSW